VALTPESRPGSVGASAGGPLAAAGMSCTAPTSPDTKVIYSCQVSTRGRPASSTSQPTTGGACSSCSAATAACATATQTPGGTRSAASAANCATLQQAGKVTKTIVTAAKTSPKAVSAPQSTRVITTLAPGRETAAVTLSEVPFSSVSISSTPSWRSGSIRSRSISPKRNYTPRRGRSSAVAPTDTCTGKVRSAEAPIGSVNLSSDSSLPKEYWTYCSRGEGRVPAYAPTPATSSSLKGGEASITIGTPIVKHSQVRSSSPAETRARPKSIECRAVFMHQGRSWRFSLSPEASVNDAISAATRQVLGNVVETDRRLGEKLSISVLPSITDTSTVGEWAHRNLDQPPLVVIKSELDDGLAQQRPELDAQNVQRLMEEQTRLLVALQKQLGEQTAIIRNQASFISELQARDRQQAKQLAEAVSRVQEDMAIMKGQLLTLEEHLTKAGNENHGKKVRG